VHFMGFCPSFAAVGRAVTVFHGSGVFASFAVTETHFRGDLFAKLGFPDPIYFLQLSAKGESHEK